MNQGAFVWAGGNTNDFPSTTDDSFTFTPPADLKWIGAARMLPARA